ncbi:BZ3500_MvSof-1268-A1-R1_Chr8-2g10206 [Microbotryum saponariae]|uniref:BZ3500_MvSof-1268-A1-R1_Chr8-2g10206 protein n=1 Tax=Microbotryum saponariae TaxID=289078 RepID=A0A2X0L5T8_9BASI|nr:BZ3500_MvSof-1268-A1-R1_Chr8-2g10206 [Microbotryum saponariae]SDA02004.1 BZ3501_MvSof-1269-A2-R1_Chr8-2g09956 [Microbotryum saponariae]
MKAHASSWRTTLSLTLTISMLAPFPSSSRFARAGRAGKANTFEIVGETGASAQQLFLGTPNKVYIVDKTENNTAQVAGHAAWAVEYDILKNTYRPLDVITNSFCAGGNSLGNGSWINLGGNQAITTGGTNTSDGTGAYKDYAGGRTVRILTPSDDGGAEWYEDKYGMPVNRWYPYIETLETGDVVIFGGELYGGFVNDVGGHQNVPTYSLLNSEYWPSRGAPVNSTFLATTQPANLYPLSFLLSNGLIFMQASWKAQLLNHSSGAETPLSDILFAQKTYPASGATAMLPLTVANDYKITLLFCGGMKPERDDWNKDLWPIIDTDTSSSCVFINPEDGPGATWQIDDDLPQNRGMGNFIILPDERLLLLNGVGKGSAGYATDVKWTIGQSFAQDPVYQPAYYNASAPPGTRFMTAGLPRSTIARMYHSSATLLADGSVFLAGSNPNADVITEFNNASYPYKTEYRAEIFYPSYYDQPRPVPSKVPTTISYGGTPFEFDLPASSLNGVSPAKIKISVIRTGFSTHSMNMGMKSIQLRHSYTTHPNGSATIYVAQMKPNPRLFQPGPALFFVTVDGVPSVGTPVMVGNGKLGVQPLLPESVLPAGSILGSGSPGSSPHTPGKSIMFNVPIAPPRSSVSSASTVGSKGFTGAAFATTLVFGIAGMLLV